MTHSQKNHINRHSVQLTLLHEEWHHSQCTHVTITHTFTRDLRFGNTEMLHDCVRSLIYQPVTFQMSKHQTLILIGNF